MFCCYTPRPKLTAMALSTLSIPYRWIPTVLENLSTMKIHLEGHKNKQAYYDEFEGILADLAEKAKNP